MLKKLIIATGLAVSLMPVSPIYAAREFDASAVDEEGEIQNKITSAAVREVGGLDLELIIRGKRNELTDEDRQKLDAKLAWVIQVSGMPLGERFAGLRILLELGANPNADMLDGKTPLMFMVNNYNNCTHFINVLLDFGADDLDKMLHEVVGSQGECVAYAAALLQRGANPNVLDSTENGKTVLMKTVERNNYAMIKLLLKHNADVNARDEDGLTALWYPVGFRAYPFFHRYDEMSKMLTAAGASKDVAISTEIVSALFEKKGWDLPSLSGFHKETFSMVDFEDLTVSWLKPR